MVKTLAAFSYHTVSPNLLHKQTSYSAALCPPHYHQKKSFLNIRPKSNVYMLNTSLQTKISFGILFSDHKAS